MILLKLREWYWHRIMLHRAWMVAEEADRHERERIDGKARFNKAAYMLRKIRTEIAMRSSPAVLLRDAVRGKP